MGSKDELIGGKVKVNPTKWILYLKYIMDTVPISATKLGLAINGSPSLVSYWINHKVDTVSLMFFKDLANFAMGHNLPFYSDFHTGTIKEPMKESVKESVKEPVKFETILVEVQVPEKCSQCDLCKQIGEHYFCRLFKKPLLSDSLGNIVKAEDCR